LPQSSIIYTGKSTLLSALSGKLTPKDGSRIEGDGLELGVFTQDLAQDLVSENRINICTVLEDVCALFSSTKSAYVI
jgi:ATPase subunit of ABC transporter with duplicated ATPase domains